MVLTTILFCLLAGRRVMPPPEAGTWLTKRDIQVDVSGLKLEPFLSTFGPRDCTPKPPANEYVPDLRCLRWTSAPVTDADGSIYFTTEGLVVSIPPKPSGIWRTHRDGSTERVVHMDARKLESGAWATGSFDGFLIDPLHGYLYVLVRSNCTPTLPDQECRGGSSAEVVRIVGLPTVKNSGEVP